MKRHLVRISFLLPVLLLSACTVDPSPEGTARVSGLTSASVSVNPSVGAPKSQVSVTFELADATSTDWVGIFSSGAPHTSFLDWVYTGSCSKTPGSAPASGSCTMTLPATAGAFDVRLFPNDGYDLLASTSVTVSGSTGPTGPSTALSPSDFSFLGSFYFPFGTNGTLTGTSDSGQITLFTMTSDEGGRLWSLPYLGHHVDPGQAPKPPATFLGWPTWNDEERLAKSWDYTTGEVRSSQTTGNPWPFLGLTYHDGHIYVSYLDYYNSAYGHTDHALVVADLTQSGDARSAGPFRFNDGSVKMLAGGLMTTPHGLGMLGSMMAISRNYDNSWGPSLSTIPYPTLSTPGGFNSPELEPNWRLWFSLSERSTRLGDYKSDVWNPYNPDIEPVDGYGYWTQRDRMSTGVWIHTSSGKEGVVFMGGMATGQVWYGSWDAGPNGEVNPCMSASRGENAEGFRPEWRIYDPATLDGQTPHVEPAHTFDPRTTPNGQESHWVCEKYMTGAYFDPASGLLFTASGGGVVNVWSVQ